MTPLCPFEEPAAKEPGVLCREANGLRNFALWSLSPSGCRPGVPIGGAVLQERVLLDEGSSIISAGAPQRRFALGKQLFVFLVEIVEEAERKRC